MWGLVEGVILGLPLPKTPDEFRAEYLNAFTVGDQLLWGAAEPQRRMLED